MTRPTFLLLLAGLAFVVFVGEVATALSSGERVNVLLLVSMALVMLSMTLSYRKAR